MSMHVRTLYHQLESRGLRARVVSISHLPELEQDLLHRNDQGEFDEAFFRERLSRFDFAPPADLPEARSLIVVAVPRSQTRLTFTWRGETRALILPPTYLGYNRVFRETGVLLATLLAPHGYRIIQANVPLKDLAVRSGLADYGRNNVTYISGWGSFYQPTAYYTDLACAEDNWGAPRMVERCLTCRACMIKCPTGAIGDDRFLLHGERCLVFHNERDASLPFPDWIDPQAHQCVIGCMLCQTFCPEDKPFLNWFEGNEEFSEHETGLLLRGASRPELPPEMFRKLERLELLDDLDKMPRNLSVFFKEDG